MNPLQLFAGKNPAVIIATTLVSLFAGWLAYVVAHFPMVVTIAGICGISPDPSTLAGIANCAAYIVIAIVGALISWATNKWHLGNYAAPIQSALSEAEGQLRPPNPPRSGGFSLLCAMGLIAITGAALAFVCLWAGCASFQTVESAATKWWASPATQAGVQVGEKAVGAAILDVGAQYVTAQLDGGTFSVGTAVLAAVPSAIRSLEMSGDTSAEAITRAVVPVIANPSNRMAVVGLINSAVAVATAKGGDPSGAIEGAARAIDAALIQ